jgi:hypothetical protein
MNPLPHQLLLLRLQPILTSDLLLDIVPIVRVACADSEVLTMHWEDVEDAVLPVSMLVLGLYDEEVYGGVVANFVCSDYAVVLELDAAMVYD